MTLKYLIDI